MKTSVYDNDVFFENYQKLRSNPNSLNEVVEKPTMLSLLPDLQGTFTALSSAWRAVCGRCRFIGDHACPSTSRFNKTL